MDNRKTMSSRMMDIRIGILDRLEWTATRDALGILSRKEGITMAKAHTISLISLWLFGKADPVVTKNQKLRLRYTLDYTFKPDKDSPSEEHRNVFDLEMSFTKAIELIKNSVTIAWQKVLREMSPEAARKTNGEVITMDMVFPGRRAATPLTKDEILKRLSAGASNDDIDDLIAQLEEMKS